MLHANWTCYMLNGHVSCYLDMLHANWMCCMLNGFGHVTC